MTNSTTTHPQSFGVLLFPGFALLDACGPLELLNGLSSVVPMTVSLIAVDSLEPVATMVPIETLSDEFRKRVETQQPLAVQRLCPTHTLDTCPPLDVLLIPGGFGVPNAASDERVLKFVTESKAQTIITVCNGTGILAATGLLDGKKATTNKWWFKEVTSGRPQVNWVQKARWVHEGRYWTSSGISAGMDVVAAYIRETFGEQIGELIPDILEYTPELNPDNDPFVDSWKKYLPQTE
ncbi:class I glutamine amidotransferase-like protein [Umbelopsis sp. AD052]|nr:class I glutamine amidotransferase-like protein [Umbelopsis sp. AD052]